MAPDLQLISGTTDTVTVQLFSDTTASQAITPTQQWSLTSTDTDVVIGTPTGFNTFPISAGAVLKTGVVLKLNSPDIGNNPTTYLVDVVANTAVGTVPAAQPMAQASTLKLG